MYQPKTKTIKMICYKVKGTAIVRDWYMQTGTIEMRPYTLSYLNEGDIIAGFNDNGFGVESINGAKIALYELYENGVLEFLEYRLYERGPDGWKKFKVPEERNYCSECAKRYKNLPPCENCIFEELGY